MSINQSFFIASFAILYAWSSIHLVLLSDCLHSWKRKEERRGKRREEERGEKRKEERREKKRKEERGEGVFVLVVFSNDNVNISLRYVR